MTTIKDLRVRPVRVPMPQPHRTASGVITESPLVLTDAVMSDGAVGHSIMFTYTAAALGPTADLIRNLAPLLEGRLLAPADLSRMLAAKLRLLGTQGLVGAALAAIDMALWDALARTRDTSLVRLLGATGKPLAAYGAVGYDGETGSAVAAGNWAKRGFRAVKAKIGYPDLREDLAVVRAMRRAVGDNFGIMVDYNQSLAPAEAVERLRALEGEGLIWVEEPTLAHDHSGHAWIAREVRTPIQCGENWGMQDLRHAIEARASDYLMFDAARIGGVTGWQCASALAEAAGFQVSSHLWPELSAQLLSATPTAHWLEYADWWNPIVAEPLRIENGMAILDSATRGTGVQWNEEAVSRCL